MRPLGAKALRQVKGFQRHVLESLAVAALGINFKQLGMNGHALRTGAHGLLEDFLGLQVASVGEVDIGFGYRVHIAGGVKLAGGIDQGRARGVAFLGVYVLAATGAKEGVGLQAAFQK